MNALRFGPASRALKLPDTIDLPPGGGPITFQCWLRADAIGVDKGVVFSLGNRGPHGTSFVVGTQVVLVANLAPRKLRGIESQGMILMAENEKGELGFVRPQEGFGNGFVVR